MTISDKDQERIAYLAGLRSMTELAEIIDAHPDMELPSHLNAEHREVQWLMFGGADDQRERAAAIVRSLGGTWDKSITADLFRFKSTIGGFKFEIVVNREQVCTARVVGRKEVKKHIPTAFEVVTETIDEIEWDCQPLLAEATA